jgi:hypothetical protein
VKTDYFEGPQARRKRLEKIASYTPELIADELEKSGGTFEIRPDKTIKLTNTGHLSSVWHSAFSQHRKDVLEILEARKGENHDPNSKKLCIPA